MHRQGQVTPKCTRWDRLLRGMRGAWVPKYHHKQESFHQLLHKLTYINITDNPKHRLRDLFHWTNYFRASNNSFQSQWVWGPGWRHLGGLGSKKLNTSQLSLTDWIHQLRAAGCWEPAQMTITKKYASSHRLKNISGPAARVDVMFSHLK